LNKKIHIAVLTGKRGGYGAMKTMLHTIDKSDKMHLSLIVTDQHVNSKFGYTVSEIERDFSIAAIVDMEQEGGSPHQRSRALGTCLTKITDVLTDILPDIIILYGDRGEVLSTALAAVTLRIPIAHIQGGDVSGNVDEVMRHAITKLSHIHFPSTKNSQKRILSMGEESWRVCVSGDNHIDAIVAGNFTSKDVLQQRYNIDTNMSPIIVLLHPETTRLRDGYVDMKILMDAVLEENRRTFVIYPCSDHGYEDIIRAINEYKYFKGVSIHKNIDAEDFWGLMDMSSLMIGNSSAGLIETPYCHIPAINLGQRQNEREHSNNVIHADFNYNKISLAIKKSLYDQSFLSIVENCNQPFGDGSAWFKITEFIQKIDIGLDLLDKRFVNNAI
jgi:GDP/UDP-N,N'-diacetylbacillosamine 2-epimerase (hydrolysing)